MAVKTGDRVRFLNAIGGGTVKKIDGTIAYVEDDDGFVTPVLVKEIVVVAEKPAVSKTSAPTVTDTIVESISRSSGNVELADAEPDLPPYEETPEGEKLNVIMAFLPVNIKELSETNRESYLVNDSNYWLNFMWSGRGRDEDKWTFFYAGTIEPGTQLFLKLIETADIQKLDRLKFQCMAYKRDKEFEAKKVYDVEIKVDTLKFFKLHCYKAGVYFDEEVLEIELIKDDKAVNERVEADLSRLREQMEAKKMADLKPAVRRIRKRTPQEDPLAPLVVDLHIEELVDNTRGMSAADMLNRQVDEFRAVMDAHSQHKGKKIVFIHGKGEGVLRNALLKELNHRYKGNQVQDASFREYGFGATQVIIR